MIESDPQIALSFEIHNMTRAEKIEDAYRRIHRMKAIGKYDIDF